MTVDLSSLSNDRLQEMVGAAETIINVHRVLAKSGDTVVGELLKTRDEGFIEWRHYPPGDIYDKESCCQAYYHAHRADENGHFHIFVDEGGRPKDMEAVFVPAPDCKGNIETLTHLISISMDEMSIPVKLFTVNHWVTDEILYSAEDMITLLDDFELDIAKPSWPVNLWLTAMVRLFRADIEQLLRERDETYDRWRAEHYGGKHDDAMFLNEDLQIASSRDISVDELVPALLAEMESRGMEV